MTYGALGAGAATINQRSAAIRQLALKVQADAFNVFNHANFEDPLGNDLVTGNQTLAFGQSTTMRGRSLSSGGFPSFYSFGGARTVRFSVKLLF